MVRKPVISVVLAALVGLALPAAAPAQAPDDRAAAREFSYAAYRLRVAIKQRLPEIERAAAITRSPACRSALTRRGRARPDVDELVGVLVDLLAGAMLAPVAEPLRTFQGELEAVPTADPALRSGRAAWRSSVALYARVRPLPPDLCRRLRRWRASGFADRARPRLQPTAVRRILDGSGTVDLKLHLAASRMVALGVTPGQARRFAGDTLFAGFSAGDLLAAG